VLKPVGAGLEAVEVAWLAPIWSDLAASRPTRFRVAEPVRTRSGDWIHDGWSASTWVAGDALPASRWPDLLDPARALHEALAHVPRPDFLERREHRWARADRAAWDEEALRPHPAVEPLADRLRALTRPETAAPQLIHGDLTGNVLFAPGQPPAVLDVAPYWRPAVYAESVLLADGLLRARDAVRLPDVPSAGGTTSLLARAVLFRLLDFSEFLLDQQQDPAPADLGAYERAVQALEATPSGR
jgi:uncharacterized protein (TIGR02569 family)